MGGVVSGVGNIVGELTGTNAAADAAVQGQRAASAAEERMFEKNMGFQREMWDWQKEQMQPWRDVGLSNLGQYQKELNSGFDYTADPGYEFRLSEGQRGIETAAASRGRSLSSATLRNLTRYNSGMASQEYGAAYGRYQDRLTRLGQLSQLGYSATTNLGSIGQQYSNTGSTLMSNLGASQSQMYQNIGAINAQKATAPFQNLMAIGQTGAAVMSGYGMMNYGMPK